MNQGITECWLIIQAEGRPNTTLPLEDDEISFGRDPRNDLVFDDTEISRQHGRFMYDEDGYLLEDFASLNGTYVNGRRLTPNQPRRLYDGDTIGLSETLALTYRSRMVEPQEPVAPPEATTHLPEWEPEPEPPTYDPRATYNPPPLEPTPWVMPEPVVPEPVHDPSMPQPLAYAVPEAEPFAPDMPPSRTSRVVWGLALAGCLLITLCLAAMAALVFVLRQRGIL